MRRMIAAVLALMLALSLCACGKKATGEGTESPGAGQEPLTWQEQYDLGVRYLSEGDYEQAIIAFTAAIEIDPKRAEAYLGRADAYIGSGETEENLAAALADYEAVLALDESCADAWLGLADVYIRQGDYDKAMEILREALDKVGENPDIESKLAELEEGGATDSEGRTRRTTHYDGSGALIGWFEYSYNEYGWPAVTAYDAAGNQTGYGQNTYDGNKETSYMEYVGEDSVWLEMVMREKSETADGGMEERLSYYDRDGNIIHYGHNYYDSEGRCLRIEDYKLDGSLSAYNTFEYDENGNETRYNQYLGDGKLVGYAINEYDDKGNQIGNRQYDGDGKLTWRCVVKYDEDGNIIGDESYDGDGNLRYSSIEG